LVVGLHNVLNFLVIDLKEVNQVLVVMAVNKVDIMVVEDLKEVDQVVVKIAVKKVNIMVVIDLDHHVQREMDPDLMVNVLHVQNGIVHDRMENVLLVQNETVHDLIGNVHPVPNGMVVVRMENGLKTMIMIIVDQVVNTNEKAEMIKAGMVQVLDKIILIMMMSM
jgi:hypothetical protein